MRAQRSIAVITFLITGWIIASLALSGDVFQATTPINAGILVDVLFAGAGDVALTLITLLLLLIFYWIARDRKILIERLKALFSRRSGMRRVTKSRDMMRDILSLFTVLALIFVLRYSGLLQTTQQPKGVGFPANATIQIPGFGGGYQASIIAIYHFFAVWAVEIVLLAIIGFSLLIFGQAAAQMRASRAVMAGRDSALVDETLSILQQGTRDLTEGTDPRGSILQCYRRLCEIFDSRIEKVHHPLTARELQEIMMKELNVSVRPLSRLTKLFEEARYSPHSISIGMKEDAITALREIEESLRYPSDGTLEAIQ